MRHTALAPTVLGLLLAAAPLTQAAARPIPLADAHLSAYRATYAITGAVRGTQTWRVSPDGSALTTVVVQTRLPGERESQTFVLGAHGLRPRSVFEEVHASALSMTIHAVAVGRKIDETAVVNGKTEHVTYPLAPTTVINATLLVTIAGLRIRAGEVSVIHDVVLQHAEDAPVGLSVGDRATTIRTQAGTFTCLPVTLSSASGHQTVWLSTGPEPVLVRYANGQTTFTLTALAR
jgi:hypothetical protein